MFIGPHIEIGPGNPAAVAVPFHTAQHSFLSHIHFTLDRALAGIYHAGNIAVHLRFTGGCY